MLLCGPYQVGPRRPSVCAQLRKAAAAGAAEQQAVAARAGEQRRCGMGPGYRGSWQHSMRYDKFMCFTAHVLTHVPASRHMHTHATSASPKHLYSETCNIPSAAAEITLPCVCYTYTVVTSASSCPAGVMGVGPGPGGADQHLAVNHFGPFLLTNLLLPCMEPGSRIVNVASRAHYWGWLAVKDGCVVPGWSNWWVMALCSLHMVG